MANVDIRLGHKNTAWFASNATLVLKDGQMVVCSDGANQGKYKIGNGTNQISALTFYGGTSFNPSGLTSQYIRGDGSYATFPTNVSSFTNDSGYITSSALSPYLTITNAALTYQPIGSYLTGLTVGSTAIGSGTNTRILYNNAGVLGEYAVTGTGTTAVLSNSPTISTSLTVTTASTTNVIRDLVGTPTSSALYLNQATPSATNYALKGTNNQTALNAVQDVLIKVADATKFNIDTVSTVFNQTTTNSGAITPFSWTMGNNTNQTASTEITNYKFNGSTKTWLAGAITTQRWNYFTANTAAFASASTITNSYGLYVEAATAGTNATITNNYAAGFGGGIQIQDGSIANQGIVLRSLVGSATNSALYMGVTPSSTNHTLRGDAAGNTFVNGGQLFLCVGGTSQVVMSGASIVFQSNNIQTSGATIQYQFSPVNNTNQTASTEIPLFAFNSATTTWATGAITTLRNFWVKSRTLSFGGASTITNAYGAYFEASTAGTNATITNNWSLGTNGNLLCQGSLVSSSPSGGVGYFIGAGSTVTQITSRTTGVTINNVCGAITLVSAAGTTTWQSFTVTNSRVTATDVIIVNQGTGTDLYQIFITNVAAGSFQITFATTGGTTTEQPVFNFSIIKAVTT